MSYNFDYYYFETDFKIELKLKAEVKRPSSALFPYVKGYIIPRSRPNLTRSYSKIKKMSW